MLQIDIPLTAEGWDEEKEEFVEPIYQTLELEHSLASLAKWESKWCKSFIESKDKTEEEVLDYIKLMTLTPNVDPDIFNMLTKENVEQINDYINAPMTEYYFCIIHTSLIDDYILDKEVRETYLLHDHDLHITFSLQT